LIFLSAVALLLAACGGSKGQSQSADATPTTRRGPQFTVVATSSIPTPNATQLAQATVEAGSPTATQVFVYCNSDVPEASATPSDVQTLPVGHACVADAGDDVKTADGQVVASPITGADIAAVRFDSNGSVLLLSVFSNTRIPLKLDKGNEISWNVQILQAGQALYTLEIRLMPGDWDVIITDVATGQVSKLRLVSIYGKRLETPFGANVLPKLTGPFTFRVWTESSGSDGVKATDWVPDAAGANQNDPDAAIPFPQ